MPAGAYPAQPSAGSAPQQNNKATQRHNNKGTKMTKATTAITAATAPKLDISNYAIFRPDLPSIGEIVQENLGGSIKLSDLSRIKVPAGGATTWSIPDVEAEGGERETKEVVGVIVHHQLTRSYWVGDFAGDGTPPECFSSDGITGVGNPGGACARCPFAEFGSKGEGQACKTNQVLFIVTEEGLLPLVLRVPPASLKAFRSYAASLIGKGARLREVLTRFTLEKTAYGEIKFGIAQRLDPDQKQAVAAYAAAIRGPLSAIAALPESAGGAQGANSGPSNGIETMDVAAFDSDVAFSQMGA
jgi:hypothetical protein